MSDGYFIETTSNVLTAEGGNPESGATDVGRPLPPDGAREGDEKEGLDAIATGADGARDAMATGETDARDAAAITDGGARDAVVNNDPDVAGAVLFSDDFERDPLGAVPNGWARVGGSANDWTVVADSSQVLAQSKSGSSTLRVCYLSALTSAAASVSARAKITQDGTSGTTTAMMCVRYAVSDGSYECLALEAGVGAQIKTTEGDGPVWPSAISEGVWYRLKLGVDDAGLLSAFLDGTLLGTFHPAAPMSNGSFAVATQSAEAAFDDVVLTSP